MREAEQEAVLKRTLGNFGLKDDPPYLANMQQDKQNGQNGNSGNNNRGASNYNNFNRGKFGRGGGNFGGQGRDKPKREFASYKGLGTYTYTYL